MLDNPVHVPRNETISSFRCNLSAPQLMARLLIHCRLVNGRKEGMQLLRTHYSQVADLWSEVYSMLLNESFRM